MRKIAGFGIVLLMATLASCLKAPEYPVEPVVTFERISRDSMIQGQSIEDSVTVMVSFTDGDGDIIFDDDNSDPNVFLINADTEEEVAAYRLDPIIESGLSNGISGDLELRVYTTCCDYPDDVSVFPCTPTNEYPVDTLNLKLYMIDAAGNQSNSVPIAPIYLLCNKF